MLPTLNSKRLTLRPYKESDAASVQKLAGEKIIADMTANIPYPYGDGMAEEWIAKHKTWFDNRTALVLAIELTESTTHIGSISITQISQSSGNLGYWVGTPYWRNGYCSEAAALLIEYGFTELNLDLIYARHLPENLASGKVITKNGFSYVREASINDQLQKEYELTKQQWQHMHKRKIEQKNTEIS